jgi:hypothetical protein
MSTAQHLTSIITHKKVNKKRKRDKHKKEEKNIKRNKMVGVIGSEEVFNEPLTDKEYKLYTDSWNYSGLDLKKQMEDVRTTDIMYEKSRNTDGLAFVRNMINANKSAKKWLDGKLEEIGWSQNMTNYDFLATSICEQDIPEEAVNSFLMACKQGMRMNEFMLKL